MLLELALVLGLGQQDTLLSQPETFVRYDEFTESIVCENWTVVRQTRGAANRAGFGSVATPLEEGTYALNFVFRGNDLTTASQLQRLNDLLPKPLDFVVVATPDESLVLAEDSSTVQNGSGKSGYQINVSSAFTKTPIQAPDISLSEVAPKGTSRKEIDAVRELEVTKNLEKSNEKNLNGEPVSAEITSLEPQTTSSKTKVKKSLAPASLEHSKPRAAVNTTTENTTVFTEEGSKEEPRYAIIFGSFTKRTNAVRFQSGLDLENTTLFYTGEVYRVGIVYDNYPATALKAMKVDYPRSWLLRND